MSRANQPLPSDLLWPNNLGEKIFSGFSNAELERICDWELSGYDKKLPYRPSHWMYWTAELYSLGRCYRDFLGLPSWVPLPIYGDHGIAGAGGLAPHEAAATPKMFITWSKGRAESLVEEGRKSILRVPHPWISFRRKYGLRQSANAKGTLIFYAHSTNGVEIFDYDYQRYFADLDSLPEEYHPLVICMHRHDVRKGHHRAAREFGLPIVSAGETSSPYFVERFYDMIAKFRFATSNKGGSELFYCEEFGVRYFLYGQPPTYINYTDPQLPVGEMTPRDAFAKQLSELKNHLFRNLPPTKNREKDIFVNQMLGIDVDFEESRKALRSHVFRELLRQSPSVAYCLLGTMVRNLRRAQWN